MGEWLIVASKKSEKIDVKRIPPEAEAILRQCTLEQLIYMRSLADNPNFDKLIEITRIMNDRNLQLVFRYPEQNPQNLAVFKANARGQVASLTILMYLLKGAQKEIERQSKEKK